MKHYYVLLLFSYSIFVLSQELDCDKYFREGIFEEGIGLKKLNVVLEKKKIDSTSRNYIFAQNLYKMLHKNSATSCVWGHEVPQSKIDSVPFLDKFLYPIYEINPNQLGIYVNDLCVNQYEFQKIQRPYDEKFGDAGMEQYNELPELTQNHSYILQKEFYLISETKMDCSFVENIAMFRSDCLTYAVFPLVKKEFQKKEIPLFASSIPLELERNKSEFTTIQNKYSAIMQDSKKCADCPSSSEKIKIFAQLKDFPLYFFYVDDFQHEFEMDTKERGIIYYENDQIYFLYEDSVDLFGCSCL